MSEKCDIYRTFQLDFSLTLNQCRPIDTLYQLQSKWSQATLQNKSLIAPEQVLKGRFGFLNSKPYFPIVYDEIPWLR